MAVAAVAAEIAIGSREAVVLCLLRFAWWRRETERI